PELGQRIEVKQECRPVLEHQRDDISGCEPERAPGSGVAVDLGIERANRPAPAFEAQERIRGPLERPALQRDGDVVGRVGVPKEVGSQPTADRPHAAEARAQLCRQRGAWRGHASLLPGRPANAGKMPAMIIPMPNAAQPPSPAITSTMPNSHNTRAMKCDGLARTRASARPLGACSWPAGAMRSCTAQIACMTASNSGPRSSLFW